MQDVCNNVIGTRSINIEEMVRMFLMTLGHVFGNRIV